MQQTTFTRPRQPDRARNGRASIWMLVISEVMLFFGLLSSFLFLRSFLPSWGPPTGRAYDLTLPIINSLLLFGSAGTMHLAFRAIGSNNKRRFDNFLLATMLLGAAFVLGQIIEFSRLGFAIQDGAYAGIFLLTMGTHAAHVAVGIVIFLVVHLRASLGLVNAQNTLAIELCAIYWYFVALIWVVIFAMLYFL